jgi:hypothetical protein
MRVLFLESRETSNRGTLEKGQVYDLSPDVAHAWKRRGVAVDAPPEVEAEAVAEVAPVAEAAGETAEAETPVEAVEVAPVVVTDEGVAAAAIEPARKGRK